MMCTTAQRSNPFARNNSNNVYNPPFLHPASSKSKALSYLRSAPANPALPLTLDGELHVKITYIDGKRSPDRTWRAVAAELRGTTLTMTIHREGKSNQVSATGAG